MKKGISPLVSSVLMIAFVVAIGIAVSQWGDKLVTGSIDKSQAKIGSDLECANVNIRLEESPLGKIVIQNNNKDGLDLKGFITRFVMDDESVLVDYAKADLDEDIKNFGAYLFDYKTSQKVSINGDSLNIDINNVIQIEVIPRIDMDNTLINCENKKVKFRL